MRTAIWFVTYRCNLHCPYCWQDKEMRLAADLAEGEEFLNDNVWVEKCTSGLHKINPDILDMTGGEPLLRPVAEVMRQLPNTRFAITTNGTQPERLLELARFTNKRFVSCTLSYHPSQSQQVSHVFFSLVKEVAGYGIATTVNFVGYPSQVHMVPRAEQVTKMAGARFHFDPYVRAPHHVMPVYSEADMQIINEFNTDPNRSRADTRPEAANCTAGWLHFGISPTLNVYRCLRKSEDILCNLIHHDTATAMELIYEGGSFCTVVRECAGCDRDKVVLC